MCVELCLRRVCCVSDPWKVLLLSSMVGTAITMIDIYSDIFVAIDFVHQDKIYWAGALMLVIVMTNAFLTREVRLFSAHSVSNLFPIKIRTLFLSVALYIDDPRDETRIAFDRALCVNPLDAGIWSRGPFMFLLF